jgi:hypothetical protein
LGSLAKATCSGDPMKGHGQKLGDHHLAGAGRND